MIVSIHRVDPSGAISLMAANVPYSNLQWTRRLSTCGEFAAELACAFPGEWPGRYLLTSDERDEVGVIEKVTASEDSSGNACSISGRFAECLWARWVAPAGGSTAKGANWRQAVTAALTNWHMSDIPALSMGSGTSSATGSSYSLVAEQGKSCMESVYAVTFDAGSRPLVSYDRDKDPGHLVVSLVDGVDRTRGQTANAMCVFALSLGTADSMEYSGDYSSMCSEVLAHASKNEGQSDEVSVSRTVGVPGFDAGAMWKARAFEDVSSLIDQDTKPTAALVDSAGALRAYDHQAAVSIDGKISCAGYLDTWDLGDLVEAELPSLSLVAKQRIEEVREIWKAEGHTVEATVGTKQLSRIARAMIGRR